MRTKAVARPRRLSSVCCWRSQSRFSRTSHLSLIHISTFEHFAEELLDDKLTTLYRALWKQIEPELLSGKRAKERDGSFLITEEDVKQLGDAMLLDPWGSAMRLQTRKKVHKIGPLKSKGVLYSAGPDGVFGNADDLYPSDNLCYHHSCPGREGAIVVVGVSAHRAFGEISVGCGCGYGAAGGAMFGSRAAHSVSVAYGSAEMRGVAAVSYTHLQPTTKRFD